MSRHFCHLLIGLALLHLAGLLRAQSTTGIDEFQPRLSTVTDVTPLVLSIPAPRGQILDRNGHPLAQNKVAYQLTLSLPKQTGEDATQFLELVNATFQALPAPLQKHLHLPDAEALTKHHQFRRSLPLIISAPLDPASHQDLLTQAKRAGLGQKALYLRSYPQGKYASHILGHLGYASSPLEGPIRQNEPMWREHHGKAGLEKVFDQHLTGTPGTIIMGYNSLAKETSREVIKAPSPGGNLVLTLNSFLQTEVENTLASTNRSGSIVILDAASGDILAMASYPDFDPNSFVPAISTKQYSALVSDKRKPLYNRPSAGLYPPGSVFKVITGLAALEARVINGHDLIMCEPTIELGGREFKNWSPTDRGKISLRDALVRSNNPFFYQIAQYTPGRRILSVAKDFGLARQPRLILPGTAKGTLPRSARLPGDLANLAIGQGQALASPLQIASMMTAFCNEKYRPAPRLVLQTQDPSHRIVTKTPVRTSQKIRYPKRYLRYLESGMFGVVNHKRGTAANARLTQVPLYGKTGTSQWTNRGLKASVAWFAGYLKASDPPIAFAVAMEGAPGEKVSGGRTAAPLIKKILARALASEKSGLTTRKRLTKVPLWDHRLYLEEIPLAQIPKAEPVYQNHLRR